MRVGEFQSAIAHRRLARQQHATAIRGVNVQPHMFAVRNAT